MGLGTGAGRVLAPLLGSLRRQVAPPPNCDCSLWSGKGMGVTCVLTLRAPRGWGSPRPLFPWQDTTPDELLSAVMTAVLKDVKLSPTQLGDICVGEHSTQTWRSVLFLFPSCQSPPQTPPHPLGTFQVFSPRRMSMDQAVEFVSLGLDSVPSPCTFCAPPSTFYK